MLTVLKNFADKNLPASQLSYETTEETADNRVNRDLDRLEDKLSVYQAARRDAIKGFLDKLNRRRGDDDRTSLL